MKERFNITYYDGRAGALRQERVFASSFLYWSYNTSIGRLTTRLVLSRRIVSRPVGWLCRTRWSHKLVPPFVRWAQLDETELPGPLSGYDSFREFFIRPIRPEKRPIGGDESTCVSPVDAKVMVLANVRAHESLRVKRSSLDLERLLHGVRQAAQFDGGTVLVFRLCLCDYHRFHFPVSGIAGESVHVDGRYFAGGGYDQDRLVPHFAENVRTITIIDSDRFGEVAMIEVGAFTIGSIVQRFQPGRVGRGDEKGWFEPGGSTVVLIFEPGAMTCDAALVAHSNEGTETRVRVGEVVGCALDRRTP